MAEFNYVLHKNNEQDGYTIVKTFEPPTFKRFELDPTEAYEKITITAPSLLQPLDWFERIIVRTRVSDLATIKRYKDLMSKYGFSLK